MLNQQSAHTFLGTSWIAIYSKKSSSKASEPKLRLKDGNAKVIALSLARFEALDVYQLSIAQCLK